MRFTNRKKLTEMLSLECVKSSNTYDSNYDKRKIEFAYTLKNIELYNGEIWLTSSAKRTTVYFKIVYK